MDTEDPAKTVKQKKKDKERSARNEQIRRRLLTVVKM